MQQRRELYWTGYSHHRRTAHSDARVHIIKPFSTILELQYRTYFNQKIKPFFLEVLYLFKKNFTRVSISLSEHFVLENMAYDKAAISFNGRETVTKFELSSYQNEINSETSNQGGHDKLDLSLGMSLSPGNASKQNGRLFHYP
ncbi:hypothetical protein Rs2_35239 [Raphanus sativus]|nr:hypothetical protein Rs2_35239 [Raphanus sativus]